MDSIERLRALAASADRGEGITLKGLGRDERRKLLCGTFDLELLRESVRLEAQADLYASAGDLRNATAFMRHANMLRKGQFGRLDPNELRERTAAALRAQERV